MNNLEPIRLFLRSNQALDRCNDERLFYSIIIKSDLFSNFKGHKAKKEHV